MPWDALRGSSPGTAGPRAERGGDVKIRKRTRPLTPAERAARKGAKAGADGPAGATAAEDVRSVVRERYGAIAEASGCGCAPGGCCGSDAATDMAAYIGYTPEQLA